MLWLCRVSCPIVDNLNKALQVTHNGSGKAKSESPRDFLSFPFARLIVCCSFRGWVGELKSNKVSRLRYNQTPLIFQFDREPFPKKKIKKEKKKKLFQAFFFFSSIIVVAFVAAFLLPIKIKKLSRFFHSIRGPGLMIEKYVFWIEKQSFLCVLEKWIRVGGIWWWCARTRRAIICALH